MTPEHEYLYPQDNFSCFDLGLTGALLALKYDLAAIDKSNRSKALFIFRKRDGIDQDIKRYWDGHLTLDARTYFDAIRCVKNRLYSD